MSQDGNDNQFNLQEEAAKLKSARATYRLSWTITVACVVLLFVMLVIFIGVNVSRSSDQQQSLGSQASSSQTAASSDSSATASSASGTEAGSASSTTALPTSSASASKASSAASSSVANIDAETSLVQSVVKIADSLVWSKLSQLDNILDKKTAEKLKAQARKNPDALWIAIHPEAYAKYGEASQVKLLKLAAEEPEAVSFVRGYPDRYPSKKPTSKSNIALDPGSPSDKIPDTLIPHLYQWDSRWGYTEYDGDSLGLGGCAPTAVAMIYQGLTGVEDRSPYDIAKLAIDEGYVMGKEGTTSDFLAAAAGMLGLNCEAIFPDAASILATLSEGKPIIANVGVGTFTNYGHFFVISGVASDGKVIINDPYSITRSSKTWDPALIASESLVLYAYSKVE